MTDRIASVERNTLETRIRVTINLDGSGKSDFATGVPFLEHMMDQIARHGMIDLSIQCEGDNHIDDHHSVEDIGITLGQAFAQAMGDKKGITRYGHAYVPLDEAWHYPVSSLIFPDAPDWNIMQITGAHTSAVSILICSMNFFRAL